MVGGFQHRGRRVNPHVINVQLSGVRQQLFRRDLADPHLWDLPQENIAGVDIHAHIGAGNIADYLSRDLLLHRPVLIAGKDSVHVQIEGGNPSGDGINSQRVQGRIDVHNPLQAFRILLKAAGQLIAHILALQLIAVGASDNADPLLAPRKLLRLNNGFSDPQAFVYGKPHGNHCLYHIFSSSTLIYIFCRCPALPLKHPRSTEQSVKSRP